MLNYSGLYPINSSRKAGKALLKVRAAFLKSSCQDGHLNIALPFASCVNQDNFFPDGLMS